MKPQPSQPLEGYFTIDYSLDKPVKADNLLRKIIEFGISNTTFLNIVNDIADGKLELKNVFSHPLLLFTTTTEFLKDRNDVLNLFKDLDERVVQKTLDNSDWLSSLTLQEEGLNITSKIVLNFITDVIFLYTSTKANAMNSILKTWVLL